LTPEGVTNTPTCWASIKIISESKITRHNPENKAPIEKGSLNLKELVERCIAFTIILTTP
jgi:hypothetical protein